MTKAKFEIGETEKHTIIVNSSALLKYIKIEVDGEKVVNEANFQPLPKKFQLEVGNSEKHHLEISAGPFSPYQTIRGRKRSSKNRKPHRQRERLVN
jgi:hypothetical protein